ncbi:MAG: glycosyltransferase family 39 protein [Chloroflexota bacterium]|nr:glycosyltransferase family 39 protein [Chloroflexota bacterium]
MRPSVDRREALGLGAIVVLAGLARFIGLPGRGTWDADQGQELLVLLALVRDGTLPLLGPPTSIGEIHHGALFYYLVAPAALLSGADPTAVVVEIALAGVAAVAVTWWLARSIGGPIAGFVAGLAMALSSSAIASSTFIWNPNLVALASVGTLAAAWRARTTGRPAWWLVSAFGLAVTIQSHILGIALLPPIVGLWVVARRATLPGEDRRRLTLAGLGAIAVFVAGYLPLIVYELGHDFGETRAAFAFFASGGPGLSAELPLRLVVVGLRILDWPLTGLLTDNLVVGVVAGVLVATCLAWRALSAHGRERTAARWLGVTLLIGWLVLTLSAPALASVTPLPVDHYHAFLDPVVFVATGLIAAAVWRGRERAETGLAIAGPIHEDRDGSGWRATADEGPGRLPVRLALAALLAGLAIWNVGRWPPAVAVDGGWPAAGLAAGRIERAAGNRPIHMIGLPTFKSTEAYGFPLERDGRPVVIDLPDDLAPGGGQRVPDPTAAVAVLCDSLFVAHCGGPAEEAVLIDSWPVPVSLVDRWAPAGGRTMSVYLPAP